MVVRPFAALSSASWTTRSDCESSADVASSRSKTLGFRMSARAMAIRCFYGSSAAVKYRVIEQTHLTAGQLRPLASDLGFELIGQRHDEIVLSPSQLVDDISL